MTFHPPPRGPTPQATVRANVARAVWQDLVVAHAAWIKLRSLSSRRVRVLLVVRRHHTRSASRPEVCNEDANTWGRCSREEW